MPVKLIETFSAKRLDENVFTDFLKGVALGAKSEIFKKLGIPEFDGWLKNRGFKEVDLTGIKSEGRSYQAKVDSGELFLFINRNENKEIYFELDELKIPVELMNLAYKDWGPSDIKMLENVAKKLKLELFGGFDSWVYDAVAPFLYDYKLNIFMVEWKDSEKDIFKDAIKANNYNNTALNTLIIRKAADVLNHSKISDRELINILGYRPRGENAKRENICFSILYNIVKEKKKGLKLKGTRVNKKGDNSSSELKKKPNSKIEITQDFLDSMTDSEKAEFVKNNPNLFGAKR